MGEKELSLEIKSRYLDLKDSIFNDTVFHRENNRLQIYEEGKYKDAIDEISRDNIRLSEQNKILILVCISSVMILGVLMYVIIQKRKLQHSYTILYRLHEQLRSSGSIGYLPMKRTFEESAYTDITQSQIAEESTEDHLAKEYINNDPLLSDGSSCDITEYTVVNVESNDLAGIGLDKGNKQSGVKYASSNLSSIKKEKLVERIYSFMEESEAYCKPDFSLDQLAQAVGSNEKYVSQVINDQFGKNFSSFVNSYRIDMACRRLDGENKYAMLTIKAIGQSVGYKSHSSFVRAFKQIVGMNPSDYQKIAQKNKNQQESNTVRP
ncbi:MAG: helix-turn-helix transcriptional regulator [Bacteroides sp.]|nr:helix-turn-helix transcriptional regulator [Bacteroides sp.]